MKPLVAMNRDGCLSRMFPFRMNVYRERVVVDESLPLDERKEERFLAVVGEDIPCSVQSLAERNGGMLENEYIILSPCLNLPYALMECPSNETDFYTVEVLMNGKKNVASNTEVLTIDNREVYTLEDVRIGCKIKVKINGQNWTW